VAPRLPRRPTYSRTSQGSRTAREGAADGRGGAVLHARGSVGDAEEAAVRALGAEIVITLKTPA
jgi:hypothetical protein